MTETLVAMAIIGFIAAVFLGGMVTSLKGNDMARTRITAESLARSEIEYVKSCEYCACDGSCWSYSLPGSAPPWDPTHNVIPDGYSGYSISMWADRITGYNDEIQKITATVYYQSEEIINIETYRTR